MAYKAKRKRHVCSTKGCRNREVILYSKNGEIGGGLYLCKECIEALGGFLHMFDAEEKTNEITEPVEEAHGIESEGAEAEETAEQVSETADEEAAEEALPAENKPKRKKKANK